MAYNTGTDPTLAELITSKNIPQIFSADTIFHTMSNLVVAESVNSTYTNQLTKGSVINLPVLSEVTDSEVTPGTVPTPVDAAGSAVSLTVNKWREASVEISEMADIQDGASYLSNAASSAGYRIAKRIDTDLGALFSTLASSSVQGSDGQTLSDNIILAVMEVLDEADVPDDGTRSLIADPSARVDMLKIDKFVRNDYVRNPVVATGQIGEIYNMPVKITNNLTAATTGNYGVIMHRDALGLAMQKTPRTRVIPIPQEFRTLVIVDAIYGVGEIRDTFGKAFYTRSS